MAWITCYGEHERVEVTAGAYDGQQGVILEVWLGRDVDPSGVSYVVALDSGVREVIAHEHLRSLGVKGAPPGT